MEIFSFTSFAHVFQYILGCLGSYGALLGDTVPSVTIFTRISNIFHVHTIPGSFGMARRVSARITHDVNIVLPCEYRDTEPVC
jgi:hypothetical protein